MVAEAQLGEFVGITDAGLADEIESILHKLKLPTKIPEDLDRQALLNAMRVDKKKAGGRVLFALPVRVGDVRTGVNIPNLESLFMNL
jgi:3-dehydroquinate synthetase